jgi:hypothetical protein
MSRRNPSKSLPVTPAFVEWQRAADRLLAVETALAHNRRSLIADERPNVSELQSSATELRLIADALFQVAFAEASLARQQSVDTPWLA